MQQDPAPTLRSLDEKKTENKQKLFKTYYPNSRGFIHMARAFNSLRPSTDVQCKACMKLTKKENQGFCSWRTQHISFYVPRLVKQLDRKQWYVIHLPQSARGPLHIRPLYYIFLFLPASTCPLVVTDCLLCVMLGLWLLDLNNGKTDFAWNRILIFGLDCKPRSSFTVCGCCSHCIVVNSAYWYMS